MTNLCWVMPGPAKGCNMIKCATALTVTPRWNGQKTVVIYESPRRVSRVATGGYRNKCALDGYTEVVNVVNRDLQMRRKDQKMMSQILGQSAESVGWMVILLTR